MKYYFIIVFLLLGIYGCNQIKTQYHNGVVIICDKKSIYDSILHLTEKENGPQITDANHIVFQFRCSNPQEKIPAYNEVICDTLIIPFFSDYVILKYNYNPAESMDILLQKGDTLIIDKGRDIPELSFPNKRISTFAINYDSKRRARCGLIYGYSAETFERNPIILILKSLYEKFNYKQARSTVRNKLLNDYQDEWLWLDSLYHIRMLDSVEYRFYKSRNYYRRLEFELEHQTKDELRNILAAYCDSTFRNDLYMFYRNYYNAVALKYYSEKTIHLSNSIDYDYKDIFDRMDKDILLSGNLREMCLFYCFRKINELFSITEGKKYYDRVARQLHDTTILNNFHRNYDAIYNTEIVFSDDLLLQNTMGETISFRDMLSAHIGKVIYVDFWASWCAPCMVMMPASRKLRTEYQSKDVTFVYLAFNDKEPMWRKAIPKAELSNVKTCYLITNSRTSTLVEKLKLTAIPRYLIYDKQGQLVNTNAPQPESQEIRNLINSYL